MREQLGPQSAPKGSKRGRQPRFESIPNGWHLNLSTPLGPFFIGGCERGSILTPWFDKLRQQFGPRSAPPGVKMREATAFQTCAARSIPNGNHQYQSLPAPAGALFYWWLRARFDSTPWFDSSPEARERRVADAARRAEHMDVRVTNCASNLDRKAPHIPLIPNLWPALAIQREEPAQLHLA